MQNESWHCLDLITMDFPWKTSSWRQYISLYNSNICLHVNGTFTHMQVTHAVCTDALIYHDMPLLLSLMKVWMVPLVFGTENSTSFFSETDWNVDSSEYSTPFHCRLDYLRWALAQRTRRHHCMELMQKVKVKKTCGQVWWLILVTSSAFNPSKCTHAAVNTHTLNTHPEQWAANAAAPREQLGVWCLAQGSHLSRGIEGGESAGYSLPPPTIPAGPETQTLDLWVTSLILYPLGHDCP